MKNKHFFRRVISLSAAAAMAASAVISANASASWNMKRIIGDLNGDSAVNIADYLLLSKHVLNVQSLGQDTMIDVSNGNYTIGSLFDSDSAAEIGDAQYIDAADMNQDGSVNSLDLVLMRKALTDYSTVSAVYEWEEPPVTTVTTVPAATTTTTTTTTSNLDFISPPIYDLYGSMPSQGEANVAIFYVDFPDCTFDYDPSIEEIEDAVFGEEDTSDSNFPFESISAFYNRSSKGALELKGKAFKYTMSQNKSYYENDVYKGKIASEIIKAFDSQIDYNDYDGDGDKIIDTVLICVPKAAGDTDWWPAAGTYGGDREQFDGCTVGHVIVGNAQIISETDHSNFVSTYLHEMGHCMGIPDFYLYNETEDWQGMHGSAGYTLMDDAICDFAAVSKLMLGWYHQDQIEVYDSSEDSQSFTLNDAQSENGNCVIIPCGELKDNYYSEFFIVEYMTSDNNNNSYLRPWLNYLNSDGNGVRITHVEASVSDNGWWKYFTYQSGEDTNTNSNKGKRFVRIIDDVQKDNLYRTGDVIDNNIAGFNWYDESGNQSIDPGIKITVGDKSDGTNSIIINIEKK